MSVSIEICPCCHGSGLEPCEHNKNVLARNHWQYIICKPCQGEGVPRPGIDIPDAKIEPLSNLIE